MILCIYVKFGSTNEGKHTSVLLRLAQSAFQLSVCVSHGIFVSCGMFALCAFMCFMVCVGVVHACECVSICTHMISSCSHFHEGSIISFCTEEDKIPLAAYTTSIYLVSCWWTPWLVSWLTQCKALESTLLCKYLGDKLS